MYVTLEHNTCFDLVIYNWVCSISLGFVTWFWVLLLRLVTLSIFMENVSMPPLMVYIFGPFWHQLFPKSSLCCYNVQGMYSTCIIYSSYVFIIHVGLPSVKLHSMVWYLKLLSQQSQKSFLSHVSWWRMPKFPPSNGSLHIDAKSISRK